MIPQARSRSAPSPTPPILNTPSGPAAHLRSVHSPIATPREHASPGSPRHQSGTLDVDSTIRNHGGDLRRTLDAVISDRNALQAQNTQLWKLIEKQRAQCAQFAAVNERLRADRERANSRLTAAGLEPIPVGSRRGGVPQSQSAMTIASTSTSDHRRGSENESHSATVTRSGSTSTALTLDRSAAESSTGLGPSPLLSDDSPSPSTLLPSPMSDRRLRHESQMQFPPEVASFMALAEKEPAVGPSMPAGSNSSSSLTGFVEQHSPYTSSPSDSRRASPIPEASEELASTHPTTSPRISRDTVTSSQPSISPGLGNEPRPSIDSTVAGPRSVVSPPPPDHSYLTPALLPHARLSIPHSTIIPKDRGRDVLCFIVAVNIRPPNAQPLNWTVAKPFSAFLDLDLRSMERSGKNRKEWKRLISPLPEGRAWKDFAPSKIDQRKTSLEHYLQSLLVAPVSDQTDLVTFLVSDIVQQKSNRNRKEGYLSKKGQAGFRGAAWKTRYFVLDGSSMKYYESRGGQMLGQINLTGAQIGRQHRSSDHADDKNSRYAFLILEAAKKESSQNRHVLSAGSDAERDSWIEILKRQVVPPPAPPAVIMTPQPASTQQQATPQQQQQQQSQRVPETMVTQATPPTSAASHTASGGSNPRDLGHQRRLSAVRKSSKDVVVTSAKPMSQTDANAKFISGAPLPSVINHMESQRQQHYAGAPQITGTSPQSTPLAPVSSMSSTLNSDLLAPLEITTKPTKRQSALPGRQSFSPVYLKQLANDGVSSGGPGLSYERDRDRKAKSGRFWGFGKVVEKPAPKPVFGVPLAESLALAQVAGLPAIVFRCIEYLEAKNAEEEEGIYRLSGASAVIKGLKERFNHEGDVNLLAQDERWDPHAIAGLLKTYMRELPTSLLTRELHGRFLAVFDLVDPSARVVELSRLVAELPPANYALLRAFTAHLILIVRNSAINKMTLRNIGIVFSPSLDIPAGIFYELVSRYGAIFDDDGMDELPLDDPAFAGTAVASVEAQANQGSPPVMLTLDETAKSKRNSVLYHAGGADAMLGLSGRALDPAAEDSNSEISISIDDFESEPALSAPSSDNLSLAAATSSGAGRRDLYSLRNDDDVEALAHHQRNHNEHP
ncbi:hypothetical protein CspeluHIS016_0703050 [Cutaneotrichosporon spelunceum]|uniref:RhoGAP-domain-containing protein n=1 Tax=Cutaneotrichosporon spelunceum TaxID=1672016 RepID=A0AAD3TZE4_9TREE|nr:hypothetical protein CspeluHIS016_0703050 [Cutaneotrichosporon spelunceum]